MRGKMKFRQRDLQESKHHEIGKVVSEIAKPSTLIACKFKIGLKISEKVFL